MVATSASRVPRHVDDWTPSKLALVQTALATALGVRPGRLLLDVAGSRSRSIVDGAPGEPAAAEVVSTRNLAGELFGVAPAPSPTCSASQPPTLFVVPDGDPPTPPPPAPPPPPPPPSPPPAAAGPPVTTVETTVTLKATEDDTLDDAAAVAALAEELGVDASGSGSSPPLTARSRRGARRR